MGVWVRIMAVALTSASFIALAAPATAQHMNARDAACRATAAQADTAAACLSRALASRDSELSALLNRVRPAITGDELDLLDRAQNAWKEYRSASCEAEYALYGGGSGGPAARLACREALTRDRIAQLHDAYDWQIEKYRRTIDHPPVR